MSRFVRRACFVVLVSAQAVGAAPAATPDAPPAPPEPRVAFRDGRLSVAAVDVPPMALLGRIAHVTGAHVSGVVEDPQTITVSFDDVPMRQAIDRIVGDTNFTLRYGADGSLRRITLRGPARRHAPKPAAAGRQARTKFQEAWVSRPPVRVPPTLAAALGSTAVPLPRLLRSVRKLPDPTLRREAVGTFVRSVEKDPNLRPAWRGMTSPELAAFVRIQAGAHARETLLGISKSTTSARTRSAATGALAVIDRKAAGRR